MSELNVEYLENEGAQFPVTCGHVNPTAPTLLFAVGRGGSPDRHQNLLQGFHSAGFNVIAPHFDMLPDPVPTRAELLDRLDRLSIAVDLLAQKHAPLFGIGHSIGAAILLVLAGATAYTIKREAITQKLSCQFTQLALLAPAIDFFRGPNALDAMTTPLTVIGGTQDRIISPDAIQLFANLCPPKLDVAVQMVAGAHHFSFMDQMPPHIEDDDPQSRMERLRELYSGLHQTFAEKL